MLRMLVIYIGIAAMVAVAEASQTPAQPNVTSRAQTSPAMQPYRWPYPTTVTPPKHMATVPCAKPVAPSGLNSKALQPTLVSFTITTEALCAT
jgi:hypothetical protein